MFHHVQTSSGKNRRRSEERGKVQNWRVHQVLWCTFWSDLGLLWESDFNNSGLSYSRDMLHGLCSVWVQLQLVSRVHTKGLYQKIKLLSPNPLRYTMSAKIIEKLIITMSNVLEITNTTDDSYCLIISVIDDYYMVNYIIQHVNYLLLPEMNLVHWWSNLNYWQQNYKVVRYQAQRINARQPQANVCLPLGTIVITYLPYFMQWHASSNGWKMYEMTNECVTPGDWTLKASCLLPQS